MEELYLPSGETDTNEDDELEAHGWYILLESQMGEIMIGDWKWGKGIEILLALYFVVYQGRLTVSACVRMTPNVVGRIRQGS